MLPEDLKDYRAPDAFDLIEPDTAGVLLIVCLVIAILVFR